MLIMVAATGQYGWTSCIAGTSLNVFGSLIGDLSEFATFAEARLAMFSNDPTLRS
jgi:hypothetical protein